MSRLIQELAAAAAAEKGLTFEDNMVERLCAYSRAVAHFPTAVKEVCISFSKVLVDQTLVSQLVFLFIMQFKWRNGWFYSLSEKAIAEGKPDPCQLHTQWLRELKVI